MKLISSANKSNIIKQRIQCEQVLEAYLKQLTESTSISLAAHSKMLHEARNLERCVIAEAVADQTFLEAQKTFRSMLRASHIITNSLKGTELAYLFQTMRKDGIELLNDLYEDIKNLENGINMKKMGIKLPKDVAERRNKFMKLFTNFAILIRGTMAIADLFSSAPTSVSGYSAIKGIINQLERTGDTDKSLVKVFKKGQELGMRGLFGGAKKISLEPKFRDAIKRAASTSPGFVRMVDVDGLTGYLMNKSMDQLQAIFEKFNSLAMDIDESFLKKITTQSLGTMFLKLLSAGQGGAGMRPLS
jgi:hypothetical protein